VFFVFCTPEDSSTVNQSRIWTSYSMVCDAAENLTEAAAQFGFGSSIGTALELSDPAALYANGQDLFSISSLPAARMILWEWWIPYHSATPIQKAQALATP